MELGLVTSRLLRTARVFDYSLCAHCLSSKRCWGCALYAGPEHTRIEGGGAEVVAPVYDLVLVGFGGSRLSEEASLVPVWQLWLFPGRNGIHGEKALEVVPWVANLRECIFTWVWSPVLQHRHGDPSVLAIVGFVIRSPWPDMIRGRMAVLGPIVSYSMKTGQLETVVRVNSPLTWPTLLDLLIEG